jgi:hypothetical protein
MKIIFKDLIYLNDTLNRFTEDTEDSRRTQRTISAKNRK